MRLTHGLRLALGALLALLCAGQLAAQPVEDGYDLWLRYRPLASAVQTRLLPRATELVVAGDSPTMRIAAAELERGFSNMLGHPLPRATAIGRDGAILLGTPAGSPEIARLGLPLARLGPEGFLIRSMPVNGRTTTVIAANSDVGLLYGAFRLLREVETGAPTERLDIAEAPKVKLRLLNHWDNLDRTVERGYAGFSLWDWHKLPDYLDPRYTDYARANASIGINGTVLTNVNANADILTPAYLEKVKALAAVFRPYGIRVYLTARFSAPLEIGGLKTADPLDPAVRAWWKAKADEIYRVVPDFGGFLVKANSEGQPGPQDYKRSHADGANMLADAVKPHGGIVMWRAFVYAAENVEDRAKQAYSEFKPLDGTFRDNVVVQVKNGAIDFQPREPFHPLFGAMPKTPLMMEFQITKEYLGFATHLAYLGSAWEEVLKADTYAKGKGSTVAKVIDGRLHGYRMTGMAGVANIGTDRNWSGSHFDQANWYAFGRLAWDPELSSRTIAEEWARMTFSTDPKFVRPAVGMMMASHQAVVDYMTPLGLHHLMATGHHYGPGPWVGDLERPDWNPTYYHRADANGIGFDRTKTGSDAVAQYAPEVARSFADPNRIPEKDLLWFHHLPWDTKMASGRPLWDELVLRYGRGVGTVGEMRATWDGLRPYVDARRFDDVASFLAIQHKEAAWWRDASVAYFQSVSGRPLPEGAPPPPHDLEWYKALQFKYAPGHH
ncbi:alpha-glucuronidase family glycosyl hydrolase [Allosphingosinicella deserti]|uniref:Xylan alpha-1,2-glucuronidase n=1 Tax=Allosphingosinicella deserti TaxID=2116704 RepID=A0A2P7QKG4_9SPHN|nr:alpha-glucuronidase family glycosyl hydrolase [Sphingomonas deserti]PSJ38477.1 alpha-glucuronidase [Sphingomonas deserti]